jgi:hypothetical protein
MRGIVLLVIVSLLLGCTGRVPYAWQDTRQPTRDDATADLDECRTYTARQYRPGVPAGEPYLKNKVGEANSSEEGSYGQWRPDRSPFPVINVNAQPIHEVPVDYTGYPGELDYYPGYLDAILEKCMHDRGWEYKPMIDDHHPPTSQ